MYEGAFTIVHFLNLLPIFPIAIANNSVNSIECGLLNHQSRTYRELISLDFAQHHTPEVRLVDAKVKVTYWDVPGNEDFLDLSCHLCSGVAAVIFVCDGMRTFAVFAHHSY